MTTDTDASIWEAALDTSQSFVVNGAAGTGKSELCMQRYLRLLARAEQPEEVLFIVDDETIAERVRSRLIAMLSSAEGLTEAEAAVQKRDRDRGWTIADQPERMQIHTLASLSQLIVAAAPVSSGCGAGARLTTHTEGYYRTAARALLRTLDHDDGVAPNLETLLLHLDNDLVRAERLLAGLLRRRVELQLCLRLDNPDANREVLQAALEDAVATTLADVSSVIPDDCKDELVTLASAAAKELGMRGIDSPLRAWRDLHTLPDADAGHVEPWRGLCQLLLEKDGTLRNEFGAAQGFADADAAESADERTRRIELHSRIEILASRLADTPGFLTRLSAVREVTEVRYTHLQWTVLHSLLAVLPRVMSDLIRAFRALGEMDLTEFLLGATRALNSGQAEVFGSNGLQHIVVDDFHDVPFVAHHLIARLTAAWGDRAGRSILVAGNPFASVCRADGAQPALYLKIQKSGLGSRKMEHLHLGNDRRSSAAVVKWVNQTFGDVNANQVIGEGGMPLWAAEPSEIRPGEVVVTAVQGGIEAEAEYIAGLLTERSELLDGSVGILMADDQHATNMIDVLRRNGVRCGSGSVDRLSRRSVIRDLHALTRALSHLADRIAWLTVLRAPWCGLTLADLHKLASDSPSLSVWELIIDEQRRSRLSEDGQQRLSRIKRVIAQTLAERGQHDLRRLVEGVWTALGGAVCVVNQYELQQSQDFFQVLSDIDDGGEPDSLEALDGAVEQLYSSHRPADASVFVTSIYHARHRVFDTVFLAGLSSPIARPEDDDALRWMVRPDHFGEAQLLLAPVSPEASDDAINRWLEAMQSSHHDNELRRLVYVGATRAVSNLYLVASPGTNDNGWVLPPVHSPLNTIWHGIAEQLPDEPVVVSSKSSQSTGSIRRLPSSWLLPQAPQPKVWNVARSEGPDIAGPLHGLGDTARIAAGVVVRTLADVAQSGPTDWAMRSLDGLENHFQRLFGMMGMRESEISDSADTATVAIHRVLEDERGRWILDSGHRDARAPFEVSAWLDDELLAVSIHRSFIDSGGAHWLIDYQFPELNGTDNGDLDSIFNASQTRLKRYARVMRRFSSAAVRTGVYFPYSAGWRESEPES